MSFSQSSAFLTKGNYSKCILLFFSLLFFFQINVQSQNKDGLGNIRVEELTDDQVRKVILESDRMGLSNEQI